MAAGSKKVTKPRSRGEIEKSRRGWWEIPRNERKKRGMQITIGEISPQQSAASAIILFLGRGFFIPSVEGIAKFFKTLMLEKKLSKRHDICNFVSMIFSFY